MINDQLGAPVIPSIITIFESVHDQCAALIREGSYLSQPDGQRSRVERICRVMRGGGDETACKVYLN